MTPICCICLDELLNGWECSATLCGHAFHSLCLKSWLLKQPAATCPACKASMPSISGGCRRLYFTTSDSFGEFDQEKTEKSNELTLAAQMETERLTQLLQQEASEKLQAQRRLVILERQCRLLQLHLVDLSLRDPWVSRWSLWKQLTVLGITCLHAIWRL